MARVICSVSHADVFWPGDPEHRPVLHDICWDIEEGAHTVLVGANGAGKTTLLNLLHGDLWAATGSTRWLTEDGMEDSRIAGRAVSALVSPAQQQVVQSRGWDISGLDLLLSGFDGTPLLYTPGTEARLRAARELARELDATPLLERSSRLLSQGQLRLLLLGRALIRRPSLLLLDECTDGLDARHRDIFDEVLGRYASCCTVILTTHREHRIPAWCAGRRYIDAGRLVDTRPAGTAAVGHGWERQAEGGAAASIEAPAAVTAESLIDLHDATVYMCGEPVLYDLEFSLHRGERWLLEGANGSGKSTFLRLLAGDENVCWPGTIDFHLPVGRKGEIALENLRRHVRLVSDLSEAYYGYDVTCLELVLSGFDNTVGIYRDFTDAERQEARALLSLVGLAFLETVSIRRLSTGQERRLFLARALVGRPSVLLLDEPCTGLDDESRALYLSALDQAAHDGLQYVFVSHYTEDTPDSVNRVARMRDGRLTVIR